MARSLDDWLTTYMEHTSKSEPPKLFREWTAIGVIAACLQRKCWMIWEGYLYPNMFIVLTAPSGVARKGTALEQGMPMLREMGIPLAADCPTRQALIGEIQDSSTLAKEGEEIIPHSSLTIYAPELAVFLGFQDRELIQAMCDWFDCRDPWIYKTKNMGENEIRNLWVNLIGGTTPDLIRSMIPTDAISGGLTSRIIFVYETEKDHAVPFPFLSQGQEELECRRRLMHDLQQIRILQGQYQITAEFLDAWEPWYLENHEANPLIIDQFRGYASRRAVHLLKLCMIHSASRSDDMIVELQDFQRGLDLLLRTEVKMIDVFRGFGKSDFADIHSAMMHFVARYKKVAMSQLHQKFWQDANSDTINKIAKHMVEMKFAEAKQDDKSKQVYLEYIPGEPTLNMPTHDPDLSKSQQ